MTAAKRFTRWLGEVTSDDHVISRMAGVPTLAEKRAKFDALMNEVADELAEDIAQRYLAKYCPECGAERAMGTSCAQCGNTL
jgi:hypothetical protein